MFGAIEDLELAIVLKSKILKNTLENGHWTQICYVQVRKKNGPGIPCPGPLRVDPMGPGTPCKTIKCNYFLFLFSFICAETSKKFTKIHEKFCFVNRDLKNRTFFVNSRFTTANSSHKTNYQGLKSRNSHKY